MGSPLASQLPVLPQTPDAACAGAGGPKEGPWTQCRHLGTSVVWRQRPCTLPVGTSPHNLPGPLGVPGFSLCVLVKPGTVGECSVSNGSPNASTTVLPGPQGPGRTSQGTRHDVAPDSGGASCRRMCRAGLAPTLTAAGTHAFYSGLLCRASTPLLRRYLPPSLGEDTPRGASSVGVGAGAQ